MRNHRFLSALIWSLIASVSLLIGPASAQIGEASRKAVPVYRFYYRGELFGKIYEGVHLYRTTAEVPGQGWTNEGLVFYISTTPHTYTVPLYVSYNPMNMDHFYTIDAKGQKIPGYTDQGIFGYVLPKNVNIPISVPLYRWVRAFTQNDHPMQDHFYQTSETLVPNYKSEGIECNVWSEAFELPLRLLELSGPTAGTTLHVNDTPIISWKVWSGGGNIRISYSTDNGQSWEPITTVNSKKGNYGDITNQSYTGWKVPATPSGKIRIKADWMTAVQLPFASGLPWATDISAPINVVNSMIRLKPRTGR